MAAKENARYSCLSGALLCRTGNGTGRTEQKRGVGTGLRQSRLATVGIRLLRHRTLKITLGDNMSKMLEIRDKRKALFDKGRIKLVKNRMQSINPDDFQGAKDAAEYNRLAEIHAKMVK